MFFFVVLPLARPWLYGALIVVSLEVLADFGTVSIFATETFTTAIYKAWTGFFSLTTARQLASLLLIVILCFFVLAEFMQSRRRYAVQDSVAAFRPLVLRGGAKVAALIFSLMLALCAAVLPVGVLVLLVFEAESIAFDHTVLLNSIIIASLAAAIATVLAVLLNFSRYMLAAAKSIKIMGRLLMLGYAVPGSVLAVSVVSFLSYIFSSFFPVALPLLNGSLVVLLFGLAVRYTAIFTLNLDRALQRIPQVFADVSSMLGYAGFAMFRRVHLPLLWPALLYTFSMVMIEVLKEMPLTLMTRPFGWDTLAVSIFEFTSEGMWGQAAYPALLLVAIGTVPVYFFSTALQERG